MARLEQIPRAGYHVKDKWKWEFYDAGIATPELPAHPKVSKSPLCNRVILYGCRTEAMCLHYNALEGENIQYVDVMSLYQNICKYT